MIGRSLLSGLFIALATSSPALADIFDEIAPSAVVCIGSNAPTEEQQAAKLIFEAVRERSDTAQLLSDEQVLATPVSHSGGWHVIAVGSPTTNAVLLTYPSYWSLDRELHYAPLGNMPAAPFTETRGFYVGGFGYFFAGRNVGFVEFDRSPFYSEMLFLLPKEQRASLQTAPPLRFLVRVTGSTSEGVLLGAKRFVETRMVYGLAIGPPRWVRPKDIWNLDDENIKPDPPDWIPTGTYPTSQARDAGKSVSFLGWLMADRTMYAGFLELTGCKPAQMWRAKYRTEARLLDFESSPHHRASGNELLTVKLLSSEDARQALKGLGATTPITVGPRTWYRTRNPSVETATERPRTEQSSAGPSQEKGRACTHVLPVEIGGEAYLILANFDPEHAEMVMREVVRSLPQEE
ncbi:MAG: hypothetical protein Q8Q12_12870 [bacterium]|nr:hypothetical protein [bacterium]